PPQPTFFPLHDALPICISEKNFSLAAGYRNKGLGIDVFYSRFDTKIGIFSGSHIGSVTDLLSVIENGEPFVKSGFSYNIGRPNQDRKSTRLNSSHVKIS